MTVRLIATDLDATLLNDQKAYNQPLFEQVLAQLNQANIRLVLATGNHPEKVAAYFGPYLNQLAVVANNGAQLFVKGKLVQSFALPATCFEKIATLLAASQNLLKMGLVFAGTQNAYMLANQAQLPGSLAWAQGYFPHLKVIDSVAEITEPIYKVTLNLKAANDQLYQQLRESLAAVAHVTTSGFGSIDIVNSQVNKAHGLAALGQQLKIAPEDMMAFGDGLNDLEMLDYVGYPVVMQNSDPQVLDRHYPQTVADNNHDGVLKTILTTLATDQGN
ncbi:HAD family hydrolase [Leuconostocaceae bacterium ESL0723]|nr:HAD family hydrolase [Leuconostocaceae bacterium ESL0723]